MNSSETRRPGETSFATEDLRRIGHRIAELERKVEACAGGAPMRAAVQEEIEYWRGREGASLREFLSAEREA